MTEGDGGKFMCFDSDTLYTGNTTIEKTLQIFYTVEGYHLTVTKREGEG